MSGSRTSSSTRSAGAASRASWPVATRVTSNPSATQALDERLGDRVLVLDDEQVHASDRTAPRAGAAWATARILAKSLPSPGSRLAGDGLPSRSTSRTEVLHEPHPRTHRLTRRRTRRDRGSLRPRPHARAGQPTALHDATTGRPAYRAADRYEASLRKALAQKPPALPRPRAAAPARAAVAVGTPLQSAASARVVYHRPPPVVVDQAPRRRTRPRAEHEHESGGSR